MGLIDLTGKRFERLTVIERAPTKGRQTMWRCVCDCGNIVDVRSGHLRSGDTKSCGCWIADKTTQRNRDNAVGIHYEIKGETVVGKLDSGEEFYIDAEDFTKISDKSWHITPKGYLRHNFRGENGTMSFSMHHYVLGDKADGAQIDHIDRNKLNNRKSNLRVCDSFENAQNRGLRKTNTSGYTGVQYNKSKRKYEAWITAKGNKIYLGQFNCIDDAVDVRKNAEKKYFGEFAPSRDGGAK